jgi:hypothetical protein
LLDTAWIDVRVKLILFFMFRLKSILFATAVLLILENLFFGFSINRIFPWSRQYVSTLLNTVGRIDATAAKLDSAPKIYSQFVLKADGEVAPGAQAFVTAKESARRSFLLVALRCRNILTPKVSPYISKSVLNI